MCRKTKEPLPQEGAGGRSLAGGIGRVLASCHKQGGKGSEGS